MTAAAAVAQISTTAPPNPIGTIPPLHGPLPTGNIPALPTIGLPLPQIGLQQPRSTWTDFERGRFDRERMVGSGFRGLSGVEGSPVVVMPYYIPYVVQPQVVYVPVPTPAPVEAAEPAPVFAPAPVVEPAPAPVAPELPHSPKTYYLIPGCYIGDVPPKDAGLPSTCDLTKTQTFIR